MIKSSDNSEVITTLFFEVTDLGSALSGVKDQTRDLKGEAPDPKSRKRRGFSPSSPDLEWWSQRIGLVHIEQSVQYKFWLYRALTVRFDGVHSERVSVEEAGSSASYINVSLITPRSGRGY